MLEALLHLRQRHSLQSIDIDYEYIITDTTVKHPFVLNNDILDVVRTIAVADNQLDNARQLFNWVHSTIAYGSTTNTVGYRKSTEVFYTRQGVCGEMAILYTVMARAAGLRCNYVEIQKDNRGKTVNHACAGIFVPEFYLVDPAYHTFGILHKKLRVLTDKQVAENMQQYRNV